MDRGHPVRSGQLLELGLPSLPRSPCFSRGLVFLAAKGANSGTCQQLLWAGTMPGPGTQGTEVPTS